MVSAMRALRFSKQRMLDDITARIGSLEREYGFEPGWGWARVEKKETEIIVALGRYQELLDWQEELS